MRRIIFLLAIWQGVQTGTASAATQLTNQERATVFVINEEARDYALEARADVCVSFSTDLSIREPRILAALREQGLHFHSASWCNRGPRGVEILITMPNKETRTGTYEIVSDIDDSDPIRLYGDHFATLLRRDTYVIKCVDSLEPKLESYQLTCCEKGKVKPKATQSPN
jgi:hypothetical protein